MGLQTPIYTQGLFAHAFSNIFFYVECHQIGLLRRERHTHTRARARARAQSYNVTVYVSSHVRAECVHDEVSLFTLLTQQRDSGPR
jgi:hypothetical protein